MKQPSPASLTSPDAVSRPASQFSPGLTVFFARTMGFAAAKSMQALRASHSRTAHFGFANGSSSQVVPNEVPHETV